jgi:LmbE family N-acetylglucosaminyl deacetylase
VLDAQPLKSALVIAPHADDEVLGAGGLIARLRRNGCSVNVLFASVDGMKHYGLDRPTTVAERDSEIERVADLMGFQFEVLYHGRDLIEKLDTVPQRDLVDAFEQAINRVRPDLLALPHGSDFDQDHIACFRAGFAAARPIPTTCGKHFVPRVVTYEMPKLTWSEQAFQPTLYVDITRDLEKKLAAIQLYVSQLRQPPHVRSLENVAALARLRGSESGVSFAEGFRVYRWAM